VSGGRAVLVLKILRGRYDGFMPGVLRKLRAALPEARLIFVVPSRALRWLPFPESEVDEVLVLGGHGPVGLREAFSLLRRLKGLGLGEVAIVYDNRFPLGYLKVEAFALLTGKPKVLTFVRGEGPWERSRWWLLGRVLLGSAYLGANLLLSAFYCLFSFLAICLFDLLSTPLVLAARRGRGR